MIKTFYCHCVLLGYANQIIGIGEIYLRLDTWQPEKIIVNQIYFKGRTQDDFVVHLEVRPDEYEKLKTDWLRDVENN
jgi:hypothetical protein